MDPTEETAVTIVHDTIATPFGMITVVRSGAAISRIAIAGQAHLPASATFGARQRGAAADVAEQLTAYAANDRRTFDLPLAPEGTPFQHEVWRALAEVPFGTTTSYAALADAVGRPGASRAIGGAVGRNPLLIVVPCHRVLRSGGHLGGYAAGTDLKARLLRLEA